MNSFQYIFIFEVGGNIGEIREFQNQMKRCFRQYGYDKDVDNNVNIELYNCFSIKDGRCDLSRFRVKSSHSAM